MIHQTTMALGAGPLYTNAVMGQGPSAAEREHARKASSTILREDSIHIEESENVSLADSWSMHFDCTTQAPYTPAQKGSMIPRSNMPRPTRENALYDLAQFLRTTAPLPPHRRPSKIDQPSKVLARRRKAMQFLRFGQHSYGESEMESDPTFPKLRDEGDLLAALPEQTIPKGYERKISVTGQRYLALQATEPKIRRDMAPVVESPSVVDSRVSICFTDNINPAVNLLQDGPDIDQGRTDDRVHSAWSGSYDFICTGAEVTTGAIDHSSTPIRPPASDPPTPESTSAVSFSDSVRTDDTERPATDRIDSPCPIRSNNLYASTSSSLPLPHVFNDASAAPIQLPPKERDFEIKHPSPRGFASRTALLQRSSTIASCRRSFSDNPGPPPRSPLRLQRESRNIEDIITSYDYDRRRPRVAPVIQDAKEFQYAIQPIRPIVVTDCTGPIPKSRESNQRRPSPYMNARKEREEKTRARKVRDRPNNIHIRTPTPTRTIDAIVRAPLTTPRQRLRKARPHIQIPDLRPAPLTMRAPPDASSSPSCKKIIETTRTPVSAVPSEGTHTTWGEKTGYTPISPTASNTSATAEARMALSPVMLIAEEVPIPKVKPSPKPSRVVVKSYVPRPRSASIPRSVMKRRSRRGGHTPSRPGSPSHQYEDDEAPPLPSPPPNRALPPTPPASGSEKPKRTKHTNAADSEKDLPSLPADKIISELAEATPHIATQLQRKPVPTRQSDNTNTNGIKARLEALEKQNALLSAALTAVLRTNGSVNGPQYSLGDSMMQRPPMAWQSRMERRSAASHGPTNSNDSAMRLYHNTRKEI